MVRNEPIAIYLVIKGSYTAYYYNNDKLNTGKYKPYVVKLVKHS